jgi:hypothetical protein
MWAGRDVAREAGALYSQIDVTGDGTVDKTEFHQALHLMKFSHYRCSLRLSRAAGSCLPTKTSSYMQ